MKHNTYRIVWTRDQTPDERKRLLTGKMAESQVIRRARHDQAVAYGMRVAQQRGWKFIAADPVVKAEVVNAHA